MMKKTALFTRFSNLRQFCHNANFKLRYMFLSCILSFIASLFEILSLGLLVPIMLCIFQQKFTLVTNIHFVDKAISPYLALLENKPSIIFGLLIATIFVAVILKNTLLYASGLIASYLSLGLSNNLRKKVYARYMVFGKLFFDKINAGYLYTVLLSYTASLAAQVNVLQRTLSSLLFLFVYIVMMLIISWKLTFFAFLTYPIFHYSVFWIIRKIKVSSIHLAHAQSAVSLKISNALSIIPLIKVCRSENEEEKRFAFVSGQMRDMEFSMSKKNSLIPLIHEVLMVGMIIILISIMSYLLIGSKTGTVTGYVLFFILLRRVMSNFDAVTNLRMSVASIKGPLQEILKIFSDEDKFIIESGTHEFTDLKDSIRFDRLTFVYPGGVTALKNVTLAMNKSRITAIVGASGAGKTTLISLIMRFYDIAPGKIWIDGVDIREFSLNSLMSKIALVSQETFIINATLKENITYGLKGNIPDSVIDNAIRLSEMSDLVSILPEGLNTNVGDRGVKLSGGEKQRVSIARAILKQAQIIILDEATSSLDSITESAIQKALAKLVRDRTTIVIAHRLSTIKNADHIIVLDYGRVIEEGSLNALIDKKGKFYQFWQEQKFF